MSTSTEWHAGHSAGYEQALKDIAEHVDSLVDEWYTLKIVSPEQAVALQWLLRDLDRYCDRAKPPTPDKKEN